MKKNNLLISQAISRGASVLTGEVEAEEAEDSSGGGTRMRPVVLENVRRDMDLYYQESFGPSVSLLVVESEEEAVEIANDTEYGLSASVFTKDLATGLRVARQIETGCVFFYFLSQLSIHLHSSPFSTFRTLLNIMIPLIEPSTSIS